MALTHQGMDSGSMGCPLVSDTRALAADPWSPVGCKVGQKTFRAKALTWPLNSPDPNPMDPFTRRAGTSPVH